MSEDDKKKPTVYFDGDCPMCRAFVPYIDEPTNPDSAKFENLRKAELPQGIELQQAIDKIHLVTANGEVQKGAKAVFTALEVNKKFPFLVWLGRLPIISQLAEIVYSFIARNRFLIFGPLQRLYWIKLVLCIAFAVPLLITRKLWLSDSFRFYALTPVSQALPNITYPLDVLILGSMFTLLGAIFLSTNSRKYILLFCAIAFSYSLFDQSRWLPYNYQFFFMFLALSFVNWKTPEANTDKRIAAVTSCLAVILFSIWFWSGLHKLNLKYFVVGFPWMISPFTTYAPYLRFLLGLAAIISTPIETGAALLLLQNKTRKVGVILLCLMHIFILLSIGPVGHNINHSVWSWNIAQIILCWAIFWNNKELNFKQILFGKTHLLVTTLFLIMPIFSYFSLWDDSLSHTLYSWNTRDAEIEIKSDAVENQLPAEVKASIRNLNGKKVLPILDWTYRSFNSSPYVSEKVYKNVFLKLCKHTQQFQDLEMIYFSKPLFNSLHANKSIYTCIETSGQITIGIKSE